MLDKKINGKIYIGKNPELYKKIIDILYNKGYEYKVRYKYKHINSTSIYIL